ELPERFRREGPIIRRLRDQGAIIMGKTHTVAFAFGGLGANEHWPIPWNPQDRRVHRAPGGSSSGAGVSLGEGSAGVARGAVPRPASVTGNVALKTTKGRWSTDGLVPLSPTFDTVGLLTRTVADAAFGFTAIDGESVPPLDDLAGIRLGIAESFFWNDASPGVAERCHEAITLAEALGARTFDQALTGSAEVFQLYFSGGIVSSELYRFLNAELPEWLHSLDRRVARRMEPGKALEAWQYLDRSARYQALAARAAASFAGFDALI